MMKTNTKLNVTKEREWLFLKMKDILTVSHEKFSVKTGRGYTNGNRMSWARVFITGFSAYGRLLETSQLDALAKDVELIKKELKIK